MAKHNKVSLQTYEHHDYLQSSGSNRRGGDGVVMIRHAYCICARCEQFTTKDRPELAAEGKGYCQIREREKAWDDGACVLYDKAKNMAQRVGWIRKQEAKQTRDQ